ncbi:glycosyltransferase [Pseudarthrobacter phenanthrenivorans]|uniref:glycosyltransferase n=1 Tax=Pseudarthrobacter phenanthrenivorans TaxID=361575 RepID=UPI00344EB941
MKTVSIIGTRGYPSFYGGFETAVRKLAPFLADRGWNVVVYGRKGAIKKNSFEADGRILSVETLGVNSKALSTLTYGLTACLSAFFRKPDIALVMNVANGFWLPLLRLRGIPVVVNVDGIEWERDKWSPLAKRIFRIGAWLTAKFATAIICDAHEIKRIWNEKYSVDGVFIPYGGEDISTGLLDEGLKKDSYILLVARFVPENTVVEFFEAAPKLAEKWNVVIVGSSGFNGELDEAAKVLADTNPRITWLGHLSDDQRLFALWENAGVYFHGHSVGGTNPALVQAMMCGAPTVARDTPYNREVLGDYGLFTAPGVEEIVEQVSTLMDSPEQRISLSSGARERARKFYNWHLVNDCYENLLSDVSAKSVQDSGTQVKAS